MTRVRLIGGGAAKKEGEIKPRQALPAKGVGFEENGIVQDALAPRLRVLPDLEPSSHWPPFGCHAASLESTSLNIIFLKVAILNESSPSQPVPGLFCREYPPSVDNIANLVMICASRTLLNLAL